MKNESWIVEFGDEVIAKKYSEGLDNLTSVEKLIYCLWIADYSMRNSGDLQTAFELYPEFLREGLKQAQGMKLQKSIELFECGKREFEEIYFELFDEVCNELINCT